jgi:hypothetical protein
MTDTLTFKKISSDVQKLLEGWGYTQKMRRSHSLHLFYFFKIRKVTNWTGHILRRNCLLKQINEGKIRGTRRRGRRRKKLSDDLKEARTYWKLRRKLRIAFLGELTLEEATDLSQDRLLLEGQKGNVYVRTVMSTKDK